MVEKHDSLPSVKIFSCPTAQDTHGLAFSDLAPFLRTLLSYNHSGQQKGGRSMSLRRRDFLKNSMGAVIGAGLAGSGCVREQNPAGGTFENLSPMTDGVIPISDDERWQRIEKAQQLMAAAGIDAVFLDVGTSLEYFTDVRMWPSERMFAAVLPVDGEPVYIVPKFEEEESRDKIRFGSEVRTWEEHENPSRVVAGLFADLGTRFGRIGMEERVRFFLFDGIRSEAPHLEYVSADPVTIECRLIKSKNEIALMQHASDITIEAYRTVIPMLEPGMTADDFRDLTRRAHTALGASGSINAQIGKASSRPHGGSRRPMQEGDVVLMDGGCRVEGYKSDISRTVVIGEPTPRQREAWLLAAGAQEAAWEAIALGVPCEKVDAAARAFYEERGYGPGYELPGCPHRTGHGIGLDGHEGIHLVRGNSRPLEVGMCFSNEPMLVLPAEFGVRLEDCFYMADDGPSYFSRPSSSIDRP
jgi:Xaa-Pro dipeptidase